MTKVFRCKGCGEIDSVGEISLVPRFVVVQPPETPNSGLEYLSQGWADEAFWESETLLGFACQNDQCRFWQGHYGGRRSGDNDTFIEFARAHALEDIAEEADA